MAFGMSGLFFYGKRLAFFIKFHHSIIFWIFYIIPKNCPSPFFLYTAFGFSKRTAKTLAIENIVSQNKGTTFTIDKIRTYDKSVGQPPGAFLNFVVKFHTQPFAVAKQFLKKRNISWGGDDQYFPNPCKH